MHKHLCACWCEQVHQIKGWPSTRITVKASFRGVIYRVECTIYLCKKKSNSITCKWSCNISKIKPTPKPYHHRSDSGEIRKLECDRIGNINLLSSQKIPQHESSKLALTSECNLRFVPQRVDARVNVQTNVV